MKTVLTYGTFDLLHKGHVRLLKRAATLRDKLIVELSSEKVKALKGKNASMFCENRKYASEEIKYVDLVIPENNWKQKVKDALEYKVVYLLRTEGISTTKIKKDLGTD